MITVESGRILDFDIENRPGAYWYDGQCTSEITAIAWSFVGDKKVEVAYLPAGLVTEAEYADEMENMLLRFSRAYEQADVVTGHFIRKHDLPIINGAMLEWTGTSLSQKTTCDTKLDLIKWSGYAKTQENLGLLMAKFNDKAKHLANKEHMFQMEWRSANRLTEEGITETLRRVEGDVLQHKELRQALVDAKMLKPMKVWRP